MYKLKYKHATLILTVVLALYSVSLTIAPALALANPAITLLPPAGPVKTPVTVKGSNFNPGATVVLSWFGFIIDVPGIQGHLGYYPIKSAITVGPDGSFTTSIITPYDFSDIPHFVNATQNGVGTGITNSTFTIVPTLQLSGNPSSYVDGQEAFVQVFGAPLGTPAFMMKLSPILTVLKFTYDNALWGYVTSHLETEGPIVTGGFVGGDIAGNATIRFKVVGNTGWHSIRGYVGEKSTPPYLSCEIGGQGEFYIRPGKAPNLASVGSEILNVDATIGSANTTVNYGLVAVAFTGVNLVALLAVAIRVFKKPIGN